MSSMPCGERDKKSSGVVPKSSPVTRALFFWMVTGSVHCAPFSFTMLLSRLAR